MKRLHKAAAVLFAAAILCSFSVFAYAAEDDRGDEWETEEISAAEVQESSQQSSKPEAGKSSAATGNARKHWRDRYPLRRKKSRKINVSRAPHRGRTT